MRVGDGNGPSVPADHGVKLLVHKHDGKNSGYDNVHMLPLSLQACLETAQNEATGGNVIILGEQADCRKDT